MTLVASMSQLENGQGPLWTLSVPSEEDSGFDSDEMLVAGARTRRQFSSVKKLASVAVVLCIALIAVFALRRSATDSAPSSANVKNAIQRSAPLQVNGQTADWASSLTTKPPLIPNENLNDGNPCEAFEEEHDGLCYKTCANLTSGKEPFRMSAFTCCPSASPCADIENIVPCTGYDISATGGCPRPHGACMTNEEYFMGMCYKKCDILSDHKFPYRTAAATCCKHEDLFDCLDIINDVKTDPSYDVGGGAGDGHQSTPGGFHTPIPSFTES